MKEYRSVEEEINVVFIYRRERRRRRTNCIGKIMKKPVNYTC